MSCYSLNLFPDITIDKPREQKGEVNPGYKGTSKGWGGGCLTPTSSKSSDDYKFPYFYTSN